MSQPEEQKGLRPSLEDEARAKHDTGRSTGSQGRNPSEVRAVEIALRRSQIRMVWEIPDLYANLEPQSPLDLKLLKSCCID